jgi:uncharacterized protein (UPF0335 family)
MTKKKAGDGASIGHNSASDARLQSFVSRIERLETEKKTLADDIKEVYGEAGDAGYDTAIIRSIIKARKMTEEELQERQHLLAVYMKAVGMLADTPLGQAALEKAAAILN